MSGGLREMRSAGQALDAACPSGLRRQAFQLHRAVRDVVASVAFVEQATDLFA